MAELKGKQLLVTTILALLVMGALGYGSLPEAYCSLEDKTVKYIHMSESQKTVTKVVPDDEGGFNVLDDRCQKGVTIGKWIKIDKALVVEGSCSRVQVIAYTDDAKYFCDGIGADVNCIKDNMIEMPFDWEIR